MKTLFHVCPASGRCLLAALVWVLLALPVRAQFSADASQTNFVCNAPGYQLGVQALADGAGGSVVAWIDRRNGNNAGAGTALYAQHLNAAGVPQLPANGQQLVQTKGRDIFGMRAVAWQGGMLVAWVQGAFGVGGDSVRCQFYSLAGEAQWAQPTLLAARVLPGVIYESEQGLNILPTSTGATITYALALNGGAARFTFNQVSPAGARRWPNNDKQVLVSPGSIFASDYYHTVGDGGDGFYMVASAGGLGTPIYAQHYTVDGVPTWADYTTISAGGDSGRGSDWHLLLDPAGNLYVAWTSNSGDPLVAKVLPSGALAWAGPGYANLCTYASRQTNPDAIWHDGALWMVWEDSRAGTGTFDYGCYAQKIDASGTLAWSPDGVSLYAPAAAALRPKLAATGSGAVMAFFTTDTNAINFRVQKLLSTGATAFALNGVVLHSNAENRPYELDYAPVSEPNGSVQVYWSSPGAAPTGRDICAGRIQSSGTLLAAAAAAVPSFEAYPNPVRAEVHLQLPAGAAATNLRLYDAQGRLVASAGTAAQLSVQGLARGVYVLRATLAGQELSRRVAVE